MMTSCKKEKTCVCTTSIDGGTGVESTVTTKEKCSSLDSETTVGGLKSTVTCKEK